MDNRKVRYAFMSFCRIVPHKSRRTKENIFDTGISICFFFHYRNDGKKYISIIYQFPLRISLVHYIQEEKKEED